jgi:hypothetical protein
MPDFGFNLLPRWGRGTPKGWRGLDAERGCPTVFIDHLDRLSVGRTPSTAPRSPSPYG